MERPTTHLYSAWRAARVEAAMVAYATELGIPTEDRLRMADRMEWFWRLERYHVPRRLAVWLACRAR